MSVSDPHRMFDVSGKVALITGASGAFGAVAAEVTGSPDDSGFLSSPIGLDQLDVIQQAGLSLDGYLASYQWSLINPNFYTLPRRIFIGTIMNF